MEAGSVRKCGGGVEVEKTMDQQPPPQDQNTIDVWDRIKPWLEMIGAALIGTFGLAVGGFLIYTAVVTVKPELIVIGLIVSAFLIKFAIVLGKDGYDRLIGPTLPFPDQE